MSSYGCLSSILIMISFFTIYHDTLSIVSSQHNMFNGQQKASKMKVILDMRRIRQTLRPLRPLFAFRSLYREHYNMLKTQWTCCPLQRSYLFDRRDVYHTVTGTYDCYDYIRYNHSQLSNECRLNLKLFDPIRGDIPKCDGGLLRNIADQYAFAVQLSNYTETFCADKLPSLLDPQLWKKQDNEQEQLINYQYE